MKAVLIGATGATGKELVDLLLKDDAYTAVVALVRKPLDIVNEKLHVVVVDFDKLKQWADAVHGDVAFSCLGTTLRAAGGKEEQYKVDHDYQYDFARIAKENGIPTFILVSSSGANPKSWVFYSRMKGELEQAINRLHFESFVALRPGPLVRPKSDRSGEKLGVSIVSFLNKIGLLRSMSPLPVRNLAALMLDYASSPPAGNQVIESKQIVKQVS